ncbi:transglutaminase [Runella rosea]|uniref:Transglutaminase n=2 Tax=Runella rosea TaxID=2259595 RepID=A0A344TR17_9BACT|nr:transglutaminase [Runella rosea]
MKKLLLKIIQLCLNSAHFTPLQMFKYFFFSISCLFTASLFAQEKKAVFGEIPLDDVTMKAYPLDTTADAVALYDYGETTYDYKSSDIFINLTYHGRIKILKKSALGRATISIPFFRGMGKTDELVTDIKGFTHNFVNGQVVKEKLTKEMIFNEKLSDNYSQYKFTLPNVREGSVIEFSYTISTPMSLTNNPKTWTFQGTTPVRWSEYRIVIPDVLFYRMLMSGYLPLAINENKPINTMFAGENMGAVLYRLVVKDAPAFRDEPYITTPSDYVSKIDFELASVNWTGVYTKNFSLDYASMNKTLLEDSDFGEQLKRTNFLKSIAADIKAKNADTTAQWQAAMKYVTSNVKWDGKTSIYSKSLKKVLEKKEGDSGDMNLLLIALLREMDYDANPLVLSTRSHGLINESYALLKKFNYVVAHISKDGKDVLLDATDEFLKAGVLPIECLNQIGWLVHPTDAHFVNIQPIEQDREYEKADFSISEDGELTGTFLKSYGGYSAVSARNVFKEEGKEKFLEEIKKAKSSWTITKAEYKNLNDIDMALEANYDVSMTDFVTKAGNLLYLKPMLGEGYTTNPFKAEERAFPVDFGYSTEETFLANFQIPKGYAVAEMPKTGVVSLPSGGGRFTYTVSVNEQKISLISRYQLKKPTYTAEEYGLLRAFFDAIIAKHNEQIVLKKVN